MPPPPPRPTLFPYTTLFRSPPFKPRPRKRQPRRTRRWSRLVVGWRSGTGPLGPAPRVVLLGARSEEHTSELQSRGHLVCRLLLEKKKTLAESRQVWHSDLGS